MSMRKDADERIDLYDDGRIILFKRPEYKKPNWYARIKVRGSSGYKVVSTKTSDLRKAGRYADELAEELYYKVKEGGSVNSPSFQKVYSDWKKNALTTSSTRQGQSWRNTCERIEAYALDYFANKRIDSFKSGDFVEYFGWREKNYKRTKPSPNTLKRERTCLLPIFNYAYQKNLIVELPSIPTIKAEAKRRPTFTPKEWTQITRKMRDWVKEGKKVGSWRDRFVAQQYFLILANTGLRVGEARELTWADIRRVDTNKEKFVIAEVSGKTGSREVIFQKQAETYIDRLWDLRKEELGENPSDAEFVFCKKGGSSIHSFKKSFKSLIEFSGVTEKRNGMARSIYSLRHFYATMRLSNSVSPWLLAKNMGTSVEMLDKHYGQTINSELADQITRTL
ncbi:tyrosine-type recombinase/integrase [Alphaproteobacteria bacterium]|nr:tyrosine-type recombinase/integrase [Alphaproteobacteria bacterium]